MLSATPWDGAAAVSASQTAEVAPVEVEADALISLATLEEEADPQIDVATVEFAYDQDTHSAVLSWDVVEGAENGYKVRVQKNGKWVDYRKGDKIAIGEETASCTVTGLVPETTYNYQLIVLRANGTILTSVDYETTIPADHHEDPVAPENIAWTYDYNARTAELTWDPVENASGYRVFTKKVDAEGNEYWVKYRSTDASTTTTDLKGIYGGKSYEFKVCAVNDRGASITADEFTVAPVKAELTVTPNAGEFHTDGYRVGEAITVKIDGLDAATRYSLKWYSGTTEIVSAANQLTYTPTERGDAITIKFRVLATGQEIVKTVEAAPVIDIDAIRYGAYSTPDRELGTFTIKEVEGASSYIVSRISTTTGVESTITSFHVDENGNITKNHKTRPASHYGEVYYFSVNMVDAGVDAQFSVAVQDENGYIIDKVDVSYAPIAVEFTGSGSFDPNGTEAERTLTVEATCGGDTSDLTYHWLYFPTKDFPIGYGVPEAVGNTLVVPEGTTGYYQVIAYDAAGNDYWTMKTAGATLDVPEIGDVDIWTDESGKEYLRFTYSNVDELATGVEIQYKNANGVWLNMTQTDIVDNGDGTFTCKRVNGQAMQEVRIRSYNDTNVSGWATKEKPKHNEGIVVTTPYDVVDWTDDLISLREAVITRQKWADEGLIAEDAPVTFDTTVFEPGSVCYVNSMINEVAEVYVDASNFVTPVNIDGAPVYEGQILIEVNWQEWDPSSMQTVFSATGDDQVISITGLGTQDKGANTFSFVNATDATVTLDKCYIKGYDSTVYLADCDLTITNTNFESNSSLTDDGGAIYAVNTNVTISDSRFFGNEAGQGFNGNAIYANGGDYVTLTNCYFKSNGNSASCATEIYLQHIGTITVSGGHFWWSYGDAIFANGDADGQLDDGDAYGKLRIDQGAKFDYEYVAAWNLNTFEISDSVTSLASWQISGNTPVTHVQDEVLDAAFATLSLDDFFAL